MKGFDSAVALSRIDVQISQSQICIDVFPESNAVGVTVDVEEVGGIVVAAASAADALSSEAFEWLCWRRFQSAHRMHWDR